MKCSDGDRLGFSVGLGSRKRSTEYPCVSRLCQRRLLSLLNRHEPGGKGRSPGEKQGWHARWARGRGGSRAARSPVQEHGLAEGGARRLARRWRILDGAHAGAGAGRHVRRWRSRGSPREERGGALAGGGAWARQGRSGRGWLAGAGAGATRSPVMEQGLGGGGSGAALSPVEEQGLAGEGKACSGRGSGLFSVQIHHGGYFLGQGNNRSYVGGGSVWLDNVDSDDWCPLFLENLVEDLGYEKQGRMTIYYCVPILSIDRNGLRLLEDQVDTDGMVNWVGCEKHFFDIYLDHDQSIRAIDWDDVVQFPMADLPPVISPMKPANNVDAEDATSQVDDVPVPLQTVQPEQERRTRSKKKMNLKSQSDDEDENREAQSDDDAGSDFALQDSDYDLSDDDDLYEDNVDDDEGKVKKTQVKENVKVEGDGDSEEEDLWAPDSDDDKVEMKLKTFRKEDLSNVSLHVGLKFADAAMVRAAIREYSCQNRREIILPINDRTRINGKCRGSDTCSWNIWVSYDNRTKCWMVKTYEPRHSCRKKWNVRAFTADFIARKFMESFKAD
ncbi:hypothetical protein QYE76_065109 [Lolium multiflorum]|uniref:Transposase MuDR plant domain-containing protein n=1 Tax=Lolium multiflorum TaxID=4521 RepID=A0AAD8S8R0_LOLMU|nr:hypothetical protein QYE76_065109 [Lolium multiflorum]